jgi:hypothetical protein
MRPIVAVLLFISLTLDVCIAADKADQGGGWSFALFKQSPGVKVSLDQSNRSIYELKNGTGLTQVEIKLADHTNIFSRADYEKECPVVVFDAVNLIVGRAGSYALLLHAPLHFERVSHLIKSPDQPTYDYSLISFQIETKYLATSCLQFIKYDPHETWSVYVRLANATATDPQSRHPIPGAQ